MQQPPADEDGDDGATVEYTLVEAHELPVVDVSRSLKNALLSPAQLQIYRAVSTRIDPVCTLLYTVAFPIGASVLTVPTEHARLLAIFKFAFQVPTLVLTSAGLRLDLLRILVTTYEFWFFTAMNAATCVIFSMHLGDLRMMLAPVYWYGVQMNVWADAKVQGAQLAQACALAAVYHVFLLVVFGLQLTPDTHPVELVSQSGHTMSSTDFLLNSFTTMMVLMARTAYRKRALMKRSRDDPHVLRFVSYRLHVASYACIRLSLLGWLGTDVFVALALFALTYSALFVGAFAVCYQRQLLLRLLTTFDFQFLSLQITLGYVCLCVIVKWDVRCYPVLTGWLWLHWVLTLDALTPTAKSALRFQSRFAIPVLLLAAVMQILSSAHILSSRAEDLNKLEFWSATLFGRRVVAKAVPFYLSRGLTISLWVARILWRLVRSDHDELTMIQGSVEFFGNPKALCSNAESARRQLQRQISAVLLRDRHRVQPGQS